MKIKIKDTVKCASRGITFHKGKIYNGIVALNQPGAVRFVDHKNGISVNKVFVTKGNDENNSLLLNKNDFVITEFPEYDEVLEQYKNSKIKVKKEKKMIPDGLKLREGFRPFEDQKENDKYFRCSMGTDKGKCNAESKFIKVIVLGKRNVKIPCCLKHATFTTR